MKLLSFTCSHCGHPLGANDLNMENAIARCTACDSVFSFAHLLPNDERKRTLQKRKRVPQPKRIQIEEWGSELTIVRRWFTPAVAFLVVFCIFWDGFLVVWYGIALTQDAPWMMLVFPLLHVAVGCVLTYATFAMLVNRTVIRVDPAQISVRHQPLPFPGQHTILTADVEQLYCTKKRMKHSYTYAIQLLDRNGKKSSLVDGLQDADEAIFLEQKIEDHLGIVNRRVKGEMDVDDEDEYDEDEYDEDDDRYDDDDD